MADALDRLFRDFDRGSISRRQLLQALGIAAVGVAAPMRVFGQGRCGGARAGTRECDTTPAKAPFEPTGWKTLFMDHFSMQATDYKREAAYYATLMGWKVRSDDGTKAVLDIGDDVGSVIIRGGYQPPPAAPAPAAPDSATGRGRGGQRAPRHVVWDSFCWGIEPWDTKKIEAELRKRGLNPVADHDGKDFQSFHVKDPGGFDLQISNGNARNRRRGSATAALPAPVPFESPGWKTVWLDHISFQCPNYKESTAFYTALLGWKPTGDEGSQNECQIGDLGNIIIRGGNPAAGGRAGGGAAGVPGDTAGGGRAGGMPPRRAAMIDHVAFGIQPWDPDKNRSQNSP